MTLAATTATVSNPRPRVRMDKPDPALVSLPHLIRRAQQLFDEDFHARTEKDLGITAPQFIVLAAVASPAEHAPSQTVLVSRTGIDRSTIANIVARLQTKGLLQRRKTKEDARTYAVTITAAGTRTLAKARELWGTSQDAVLISLSLAQRKLLHTMLSEVIASNAMRVISVERD